MRNRIWTTALIGCWTMVAAAQQPASISGRILRPEGAPAVNAVVFAAVTGPDGQPRTVAETATEWDGRYRLERLAPGRYVIGARLGREGPPTYYPNDARSDSRHAVRVFAGVPAEAIDIWLQPLPRRHTVSGRLHWPETRPVKSVTIDYGGPENPRKGIWYVSDPGGLFTIEAVPPGTMVMLARAETDDGSLVGLATTEVTVGSVEDVRIMLEPTGAVQGRVVFARARPAGMSPRVVLTHSLLQVSPLYPVEAAAVDATGRFAIDSARGVYRVDVEGLPAGWTVTRVRRDGRDVAAGRLSVGPAETVTSLEVTVGPRAK